MTVFWIIAGLMIVVALIFILPPLVKRSDLPTVERNRLNADIYKDQFSELEADLRNGVLSQEQFEQGRLDLERNLLADVTESAEPTPVANKSKTGQVTAAIVGLALPVLAVGIYIQLGQYEAPRGPQDQTEEQNPMSDGGVNPEDMVAGLAERLKSAPEDAQGWQMLGRSYVVLERYPEASAALAKAYTLLGDKDPQLLADYAEAIVMSKPDEPIAGLPTELFQKALTLDPDNAKALWLAGMTAFQENDFPKAVSYWQRLTTVLPADSPDAQAVKKFIADAERRDLGITLP